MPGLGGPLYEGPASRSNRPCPGYPMAVMKKGTGEIGITGTAAAIGNAAWPAIGRRVRNLPITPAKPLSEEPHSAPGGRRGADGSGE